MKTLSIQSQFNNILEAAAAEYAAKKMMIATYGRVLSKLEQLALKFNGEVSFVQATVDAINTVRANRRVKQISAVAKKRHKKAEKVARATKGLFTVSLFEVMEAKASSLLRRVGINPTSTPTLELMAIPVEEAGFLFNTGDLCASLKAVIRMAAKAIAA